MDVGNESNADLESPSLSKTSAADPMIFVEDDEFEVMFCDKRFYRRRKRKPIPEWKLPKGSQGVTLAEALAKIDPSHLENFLNNPWKSYPDLGLGIYKVFDLVDYFGSALSGVSSSVEYQYPWPEMDFSMELIDLPFRHIPEPVYKTAADWINKTEEMSFCTFIMWSIYWIRDRLEGVPTDDTKSELGVLVALSMILRSKPRLWSRTLPLMRQPDYELENSQEMIPLIVWMMAQVAQVDLRIAFHSWSRILFPLVRERLKDNPRSIDLILQLIENVLSQPRALATILEDAVKAEDKRLFPIHSFEILLLLTFPASFERVNVTARFEAVYPSLKEVALADAPGIEEMKKVTRRIFEFSLKFIEQGNPVLAKEATAIAIWCLNKNTQDTERFEAVYPLLKKAALAHAPGEMNQITQHIFASSFKFAGEGNFVLAKEATEIAILCLTKNVDCCNQWDKVYMDNPKASVALLKKLVDEWKHHSLKLLSSPRDTLTLNLTMKIFRLKNEQGITKRGASAFLYEEADKYSKEISRRLSSRGTGFLKGCTALVILVAVGAITAPMVLSSSLLGYLDEYVNAITLAR